LLKSDSPARESASPESRFYAAISPRFEDYGVTESFQALDQSLLEVMLVQAVEVVQAEILEGSPATVKE